MNEMDVNALDSLLDGNTTNTTVTEDGTETNTGAEGSQLGQDVPPIEGEQSTNSDTGETTEGGDPNLESSTEDAAEDEGAKQRASAQNKAFAQMRVQLTQYDKTIKALAKALGLDTNDPRLNDNLINMAQTKLAQQQNVPVELYKELESTKERLAAMEIQHNESLAVDKLMGVKEAYGLTQEELVKFAKQLDQDGISLAANPHIDAEYEYYKRNREAIEQQKINAAVEAALKGASQAETQSTSPNKLQGKGSTDEPKIDNVSALNDFLENK